jgi:8-amino-3,8-dideoxy-alpha-D-manno-octulosonate transaminase
MELQGAVGLAQLKKLDYVVEKQRENADLIEQAIADLSIEMRTVPDGSFETADALVFFVDNNRTARKCRDALLKATLGTKILPEAITWHFAGTWDHMPELVNRNGIDLINAFPVSLKLLNRSVSLPITINMVDNFPTKIRETLMSVLK